jgi:lipoate-protein ligase A
MIMHPDTALSTEPAQNALARDWDLFQAVETGSAECLWRTWQSTRPVVVLGRHTSVADHVIVDACREDQVAVLRRFSGGGPVVLGPGCLNYAVALSLVSRPWLADVATSFEVILGRIVRALRLPGLTVAGGSDLAIDGRKVSGNAQRRGRRALLHHGTLLYDFDATLAGRYLREPVRQPAYRERRPHAEFLGNLPLVAHVIVGNLEVALMNLEPDPGQLRPRSTYA